MRVRPLVKNNIITRPLKTSDIGSIVDMALNEGWILEEREFEIHRRLRRTLAAVLTDGQTVIGCITAFAHHRAVWIGNLIVRSEWRGQGHGSSLIKLALNWADSRFMETSLLAADVNALSLYRRSGFKPLVPIYRWCRSGEAKFSFKKPIVLDAFPANRPLSKTLDARGFTVASSTLLMYRGRRPAIKFHNVLATATLGSMG